MAATARRVPEVEGATRSGDMRGELQLACAVVEAAFNDLTSDVPNVKFEARLFCTAIEGGWAQSRREWCTKAGIEESALVRAAKKVVAETTTVVLPTPRELLAEEIRQEHNATPHRGLYRPAAGIKALAAKHHVSSHWVRKVVHEVQL
jgi:hypothetical protein